MVASHPGDVSSQANKLCTTGPRTLISAWRHRPEIFERAVGGVDMHHNNVPDGLVGGGS